jgi:putative ABC transport system ATP-binding protein
LTTAEPIIRVEGASRVFEVGGQKISALRDVSVEVARGEFLAVIGRSGSGKTTLLNVIAGLDRPTSGSVFVDGEEVSAMSEGQLTAMRRKKIGFIFQSFGLLPLLSAYENVEIALRIAGAGIRERGRRTEEVLEMVGLTRRAHHRPYELSGGEQQRVAIARALANKPPILLADEPTGELDSNTAASIFKLLLDIVEREKVTIVTATHDRIVIEQVHRVIELADGALLAEPTLLEKPKKEAAAVPRSQAPVREKRPVSEPRPERQPVEREAQPVDDDDDMERWAPPERRSSRPIYQPPRSPREPL